MDGFRSTDPLIRVCGPRTPATRGVGLSIDWAALRTGGLDGDGQAGARSGTRWRTSSHYDRGLRLREVQTER